MKQCVKKKSLNHCQLSRQKKREKELDRLKYIYSQAERDVIGKVVKLDRTAMRNAYVSTIIRRLDDLILREFDDIAYAKWGNYLTDEQIDEKNEHIKALQKFREQFILVHE